MRFTHRGDAVQIHSIIPHVAGDQGWTTVETLLIQLDTNLTPFGRFPAYANETTPDESKIRVGYDAAVCVQKYEPWMIETYNTSTGSPVALRVVGKGDGSIPLSPSGEIRGARLSNARYLNTRGKDLAFSTAHANSVAKVAHANFDMNAPLPAGYYAPTLTVGPTVPPRTAFLLTRDSLHRLLLSLMALDIMDIPNSLPSGLLHSVHGSVRLILCRTWWGRDLSSRNRTRMRRWHLPLTSSGS